MPFPVDSQYREMGKPGLISIKQRPVHDDCRKQRERALGCGTRTVFADGALELDAYTHFDRVLIELSIDCRCAEIQLSTAKVVVAVVDATEDAVSHGVVDARTEGVTMEAFGRLGDTDEVSFQVGRRPSCGCVNQRRSSA